MTAIHPVRLEILRHGPPNNQLLSPLTPYLALCESYAARTLTVPWEQRDLVLYARALAYKAETRRGADIQRLGEQLGELLEGIAGLRDEVGQARTDGALVHLRLVLTANELAQVPFELALAPVTFSGAGQALLLQSAPPIVLTREVRRVPPDDISWPRDPRILFVAAQSAGVPEALIDRHALALRRALDPWVAAFPGQKQRVGRVSELLTVLPDASLRDVEKACRARDYTHVHVLAHGAVDSREVDDRYGVRLRSGGGAELVHGDRFAEALRTDAPSRPTVVTLASCDTGNVGTLLSPGGSFAHALQERGVAFVVASQVPLSEGGSVVLVDELYRRLLWGEDPRVALYETRTRLFVDRPAHHDWAALVCYATLPRDLGEQLRTLRTYRARMALDCATEALPELSGDGPARTPKQALLDLARVFERRAEAERRLDAAIEPGAPVPSQLYVEHEGLRGAARRWKAWIYEQIRRQVEAHGGDAPPEGLPFPTGSVELRARERAALMQAKAHYLSAFQTGMRAHWVAIQHMLLCLLLGDPVDTRVLGATLLAVEEDLNAPGAAERSWAYVSCIELHVLWPLFKEVPESWKVPTLDDAEKCARRILELTGLESEQARNTARHLRRYEGWRTLDVDRDTIDSVIGMLTCADPKPARG